MKSKFAFLLWSGLLLAGILARGAEPRPARTPAFTIVCAPGATSLETLASREVQRFVYLCTGRLLPILVEAKAKPARSGVIIVSVKNGPLAVSLTNNQALAEGLRTLAPQAYWLKSIDLEGSPALLVAGGDPVGTLYAAYRFAEHLGVRFYLHGDVIPDERAILALPSLDERAQPLFALRGIQPFHDFPEGPDWWNEDTYAAVLSQLAKLRMNFFGLHTYPEGGPNAEPTVWIGPASELDKDGRVIASYPSSYQNTLRGNWGYDAKPTGEFAFGASQFFEQDAFGAEVMFGVCPQPATPGSANQLFGRVGDLLDKAFRHARTLGIKTCVGTETPLTVPAQLKERLKAEGKNPADPAVVQSLYEGIFQRIMKTYPVDYYWFWTPEGWTWEGTKEEQVTATISDLKLAIQAAANVRAPFRLATCGWVLGPPRDRALFDKTLPKDMAVSCINREVGKTPVEPGFAEVKGRSKWAIPWMEDDPALTSPQLWVGRMRQDAVDARQYGCDGLMGIHWRTRVLGPNISALAQAAWSQSPWSRPTNEASGWVGGSIANYPNNLIADTDEPVIYQSVRYGMSACRVALPNGAYRVTLQFCEPHYDAAGKRVFGVRLQGETVLDRFDILAKVGKNRAVDYTSEGTAVTNGWLTIEFVQQVEFPSIAGLIIEGPGISQKINCGGAAWGQYVADLPAASRYQPTGDFYRDWARQNFGTNVAEAAARVFEKIDGQLPRPSDWVDGPGGLRPDPRPWEQAAKDYAFVDEFAALRPQVAKAGYAERFDYWLNTFRYARAMGHVNCIWAQYNQAIEKTKAEKDAAAQRQLARDLALPLRRELINGVAAVYANLLPTVTTAGELGTVANWEQHIQPRLLGKPGEELAKILGEPLPSDAQLPKTYSGPPRIVVPTLRSSLSPGEPLRIKVLVLSISPPAAAEIYWRELGRGQFAAVPLQHVARGVYTAKVPADQVPNASLEYFVKVTPSEGKAVMYPATAPSLNQTVVRF